MKFETELCAVYKLSPIYNRLDASARRNFQNLSTYKFVLEFYLNPHKQGVISFVTYDLHGFLHNANGFPLDDESTTGGRIPEYLNNFFCLAFFLSV